jgi:ribosomal protein S18 acetylase RimI-like enzyme
MRPGGRLGDDDHMTDVRTWTMRRVRPGDGPALRDLRLHALEDTPIAFHETYADAVGIDEAGWTERVANGASGPERAVFITHDESGRFLAMMGGYVDEKGATLFGVFVRPEVRGSGMSDALIEAVAAWATAGRHPELRLFVHDRNEAALALYRRHGFEVTGERQPHPNVAGEHEVIMVRRLTP